MPRLRVIILTQDPNTPTTYNVAFWADVPSARQPFYANTSATSAWAGATATDIQNLQNGSVVEAVAVHGLDPGTPIAQFLTYLQQQWTVYQQHINNFNPWQHYGSNWDGTTWITNTVA